MGGGYLSILIAAAAVALSLAAIIVMLVREKAADLAKLGGEGVAGRGQRPERDTSLTHVGSGK